MTKENVLFRRIGVILFLLSFFMILMVGSFGIVKSIIGAILFTCYADIIGGIGKKSPFFTWLEKKLGKKNEE